MPTSEHKHGKAIGDVLYLMQRGSLSRAAAVRIIAKKHDLPEFLLKKECIEAGVPSRWGFKD